MKTIDTRRYEMFVRAGKFGETYRDLLKESSLALEQFAIVAATVKELSDHAVTLSAVRDGRSHKVMAREALVERLSTISRTARGIAEDTPGLEDKFHLAAHPSDQALLTAGRLFARDAKEFEDRFIAHSMAPTFLADLNALVEQFEGAIHARLVGKEDQIGARESIRAAIESGLTAVRKLDAILINQLHDDRATLAKWRFDRRIDYSKRGGGRKTAAASAPQPAATDSAATTGMTS